MNGKKVIIFILSFILIFLFGIIGVKAFKYIYETKINPPKLNLEDDYYDDIDDEIKDILQDNKLEVSKPRAVNVQKSDKDRINFLILGVGGLGHDGGNLTDTIIFGSFSEKDNSASLLSIPRDLYINMGEDIGYAKINHSIFIGDNIEYGYGLEFAQNMIEQTLDEKIDYIIKFDFLSFEKIIDVIGGVYINVDTAFTDEKYPTFDYGYETISFETGYQVMDGKTALKYARSRHGNNGEGSDFARSKRQEKIILAVSEKILALKTLSNPAKLYKIITELDNNIDTNIKYRDVVDLYDIAKNVDTSTVVSRNLDEASGYAYATRSSSGASIVKPTGNNFNIIRDLVDNIFDPNYNPILNITDSMQNMTILNGTFISGIATYASQKVKDMQEFKIYFVGNAPTRDYKNNILIDISGNNPLSKINSLASYFDCKIYSDFIDTSSFGSNLVITDEYLKSNIDSIKSMYSNSDLVFILGENFEY